MPGLFGSWPKENTILTRPEEWCGTNLLEKMVLGELGNRLTSALNRLNQTTIVDDEIVSSMLLDISRALLESDVNVKIVGSLRNKIKTRLAMDQEGAGINKRKLVQRVVMEELV